MENLRAKFLLRKDINYLNHGSFGACPIEVFQKYQDFQLLLESQPVEFFAKRLAVLKAEVRQKLGFYLNAPADCLVTIPNATFGVNLVARALKFSPGDEILSNNHEYGACNRVWRSVCQETGAIYRIEEIPTPINSSEQIVEAIWSKVSDKTKLLFLSHITSPTALIMPVKELIKRARERGILTLIDGAHAPGQLDLNLNALGADFYTGNCHKWMCAPKGSAFLYARQEKKSLIKPLVISWGNDRVYATQDPFIDELEILGTDDPSAYLSIPDAIEFQARNNWSIVRAECHKLIQWIKAELENKIGAKPLYADDPSLFSQMVAVELPRRDPQAIKARLIDEFKIEVPVWEWNNKTLLRVSVQGYNTKADLENLVQVLRQILN